jgi:predicted AlkP superfamily pyrophosphatase or phosphodiesterase
MRQISQVDVAPTIANIFGISMPRPDGLSIESVKDLHYKNAILIIVDSLGYDLYKWLLPKLKNTTDLARKGQTFQALSVSNHTSPAIASILSGLLPEHHGILDTESAKRSPILSIPEIASSAGMKSAVVMEKGGAEIYDGLIEFIGAVPRTLSPSDFDKEICRLSLEALSSNPRLLVTYFIGLDKAAHNGLSLDGFKDAALAIDDHIGKIVCAALPETLIFIIGDHPIHAGRFKRNQDPHCVALIIGEKPSM